MVWRIRVGSPQQRIGKHLDLKILLLKDSLLAKYPHPSVPHHRNNHARKHLEMSLARITEISQAGPTCTYYVQER